MTAEREFVEPDLSSAGTARGALEQAREALGNALVEEESIDLDEAAALLELVNSVSKRARTLSVRAGPKTKRRRR